MQTETIKQRELEFRFYDPEDKEMKFSGMEVDFTGKLCVFMGENECPIMQFTGMKDVKGKKIFEGDICKQNFNGKDEEGIITIDKTRGIMVGSKPIWWHNVEVIGNIYG